MWSAEQNICQAGKGVFYKIPAFPVMSLTKILETFSRYFPPSFNRKYVHTVASTVVFVAPARLVIFSVQRLFRAAMLLVLFPAVQTKTMVTRSL